MAQRNVVNGAKYREAPPRVVERILASEKEVTPEGCWLWCGQVSHDGYGFTNYRKDGRRPNVYVHRLVYMHFVGDPGDDTEVDHTCHDPQKCTVSRDQCPHRRCWNPAHLEAVAPGINLARSGAPSTANGAKTSCDRGHEFTPANTRRNPNGSRSCRECCRINRQARTAAEAAARPAQAPRYCCKCGTCISGRRPAATYCEACNPPSWRGSRERMAARRTAGRQCACCGYVILARRYGMTPMEVDELPPGAVALLLAGWRGRGDGLAPGVC
jgi:hypothetical protein